MSYRDVFGDVLADHHENPRHFGRLENPTAAQEGFNPVCGDKVFMTLKSEDGNLISELQFEGEGCSICMASASILAERVQGKSKAEVLNLIEHFREKMQGKEIVEGLPEENDTSDDLTALYGIKRFPVRIKCALLAWTTLKQILQSLGKAETQHV